MDFSASLDDRLADLRTIASDISKYSARVSPALASYWGEPGIVLIIQGITVSHGSVLIIQGITMGYVSILIIQGIRE